ncbi:MAG TPA: PAS domain S-box protein [Rhodanobacteraceae bacterium]|nr:PAS domain S-box protein [Rhodanobacteraceae bacterium]
MNWIDIVWPMMGAASLTLALIHLLVWFKQREHQSAHLMFAITGISVAALAIFELLMMTAPTAERYGVLLRWVHVPFALMMIGIVAFVRLNLQVGRIWLGVLVCVMRLVCLLPDFLTGENLNFIEITSLRQVPIWGGGFVAAPVGVPNPWMALGQASVALLLVFLVDALVSGIRRTTGEYRRKVMLICGSMIGFLLLSAAWSVAVVSGTLHAPLSVNPAFTGVLLVMTYELGGDILRAAQLAKNLSASEAHLRETEQRMDMAVRGAGIGLWSSNVAQENSWVSETGMRVLGFGPDEKWDLDRFYERLPAADRKTLQDSVASAIAGDGEFSTEYRIIGSDGRTRWIMVRGQVEFDVATRAPLRMRGIVSEITERRQAEERLRLVVEMSPTALLMVDEQGLITLVNRQAEAVLGYAREEMVGMNVETLVPARYRERHGDYLAAFFAHAGKRAMGAGRELCAQRKDGSEVPAEIALRPIQGDAGISMLVSITDISERKRADRESALQRDELAHLSRVALLAELSGSLAHELNQPLTAILSNAQAAVRFLAHSPPNLEEVRDSLINIVENDKRAGEVIRRLRAMLRKDRADHRRLDMNDVVLDVQRIIRSDLLNRNVDVVLDLGAELPPVEGDRVQLQQVLLNLVMNGTDAMADASSGRNLTLHTHASDAGGVHVSVMDSGCGIPEEDIERIFFPFVTTKATGIGLGLAVCASIIHTHRGTIWATNNADRGATVHFKLPALGDTSHPSSSQAAGS